MKESIILFVLIFSCASLSYGYKAEDIRLALYRGLTSSMKNIIKAEAFIEKIVPKLSVFKRQYESLKDENPSLNSTVLVKALDNLKNILPRRISMIPFAVAEPTADNILVFFGILNSNFVNLTNFNADASVNNTNSTTAMSIQLHINTSSLEGHYELDVCNYAMHIYGDGNYSVISNSTEVSITTSIEIFPNKSFLMSSFAMNINIQSVQLIMTNFMDGDPSTQPLLDLIASMIPPELGVINDLAKDTVNSTVTDFFNSAIASLFTWDDFVGLIQMIAG